MLICNAAVWSPDGGQLPALHRQRPAGCFLATAVGHQAQLTVLTYSRVWQGFQLGAETPALPKHLAHAECRDGLPCYWRYLQLTGCGIG